MARTLELLHVAHNVVVVIEQVAQFVMLAKQLVVYKTLLLLLDVVLVAVALVVVAGVVVAGAVVSGQPLIPPNIVLAQLNPVAMA